MTFSPWIQIPNQILHNMRFSQKKVETHWWSFQLSFLWVKKLTQSLTYMWIDCKRKFDWNLHLLNKLAFNVERQRVSSSTHFEENENQIQKFNFLEMNLLWLQEDRFWQFSFSFSWKRHLKLEWVFKKSSNMGSSLEDKISNDPHFK